MEMVVVLKKHGFVIIMPTVSMGVMRNNPYVVSNNKVKFGDYNCFCALGV